MSVLLISLMGCDRDFHTVDDDIEVELKKGMPAIILVIPDNIGGQIELEGKDGTKYFVDARHSYTQSFKTGWVEYWRKYNKDVTTLDDATSEPQLVQEYGHQTRARSDGYFNCRLRLIALHN